MTRSRHHRSLRGLLALACAALWLVACEAASAPPGRCFELPEQPSPVVARVGTTTLRLSDLQRRLDAQGPAKERYGSTAALRRFVEDQVRFELLAEAALARGLDRDPDVVDAARKVMVRKLLLADLGADEQGDDISDEAVLAYYESHRSAYMQPERRRLAHIELLPTAEGRALARQIIDKLRAVVPEEAARSFGRYAAQHSRASTARTRGGELAAFVSEDELVRDFGKSFAEAAFRLGVLEVSSAAVQSTRGWHVLLVLAKRDSYARSFEEVAPEIRARLGGDDRSRRFQTYLRDLRARYPVTLFDEPLSELRGR